MDYLHGEPLYKCIWNCGHFTEEFTKACAIQIIQAILDLHERGFMHRDVKSGNILLTRSGKCHLIDFGFAKACDESTRTMSICGTYYVMAPEMFHRKGYSATVDWW
jgi:serine/threonine protein kinase